LNSIWLIVRFFNFKKKVSILKIRREKFNIYSILQVPGTGMEKGGAKEERA